MNLIAFSKRVNLTYMIGTFFGPKASVEKKAQEADILTSRIQELENQLDREKEEYRRY